MKKDKSKKIMVAVLSAIAVLAVAISINVLFFKQKYAEGGIYNNNQSQVALKNSAEPETQIDMELNHTYIEETESNTDNEDVSANFEEVDSNPIIDDIMINTEESTKENNSNLEEVREGSWQAGFTVTPEILNKWSIMWQSGNVKKKIDVNELLQEPELPSGCEVTSLTADLNYLGYSIDKMTMVDKYLDMGEIGLTNPYEAFVGTPDDNGSYGCFAPVIVKCANKFLKDEGFQHLAYDYSGNELQNLFQQIDLGNPVIIWATIDMNDTYNSAVWEIDGENIYFPANEHCLLLTGYDYEQSVVYIMDPMVGNVTYDMALFNYRFHQIGSQAVVIK